MKKIVLIISIVGMVAASNAAVFTMAQWTFDSYTTTNPATGPHVAENGIFAGSSQASGSHASSAAYSMVAGNFSTFSYSSNTWAVGDYYQFKTSTLGYGSVKLSFDATGSNTGPRDFKVAYSTNGTTFSDLATGAYSLTNDSWSTSGPYKTASSRSFDLSSLTVLNNKANVWFRLINTSTTSINGGTVAGAGTSRVDNVTVTAVPEPFTMGLGLAAAGAFVRRRFKK